MAIIRSFDKPFEVTDLTEELMLVPNTYGLVNELGIFRSEAVAQNTITVEAREGTLGLVVDQPRGTRNNVNKDDTRGIYAFPVPHHPLDDYIAPEDIQGKRAYGSDAADNEAAVLARKIERIRRNHAVTVEFARCYALTTGGIWSPNGSVGSVNFYTTFGVTRKEVPFDLANGATDVLAKQREVIDHIQQNILSGEVPNGIIALCSPEFFDAYVSQAGVKEAYKYFTSTQNPLRDGLRSGRYAMFTHGDVTLYRYIGSYENQKLIPANEAYFMPAGTMDSFISYYGPANKLDLVNTLGEEAYLFQYRSPKGDKIELESEHNAIHLMRRPACVVRAVKGASV